MARNAWSRPDFAARIRVERLLGPHFGCSGRRICLGESGPSGRNPDIWDLLWLPNRGSLVRWASPSCDPPRSRLAPGLIGISAGHSLGTMVTMAF